MKSRGTGLFDDKLAAALLLIGCCLGLAHVSYNEIYKATPDYSFSQIMAATTPDDETFRQLHMDETELAAQLWDGIIAYQHSDAAERQYASLALLPSRHETLTAAAVWWTHALTGSDETPEILKARDTLQSRLRAMGFPIPITGWKISSTSWSHPIDSAHAEMTIYLYNASLEQQIPCAIRLERISTKDWRITGVTDVAAFVQALSSAYESALAKENEAIQEKISEYIEIQQVTSTLIHQQDRNKTLLQMQYTPIYHEAAKEVVEAKGVYELRLADTHGLLYTAPVRLSLHLNKSTHINQFLVHSGDASQPYLWGHDDLSDTISTLRITSITLRNGTSYALQTTLSK